MMAAEAGAARNTLLAYGRDLDGASELLGGGLAAANAPELQRLAEAWMPLKRATVAQLCIECHSPLTTGTLGSQPPSFHNLRLPRYQNCTTCHVAVHGSNRDPQLLK